MNMMDILRAAQGGQAVDTLARNHGVERSQMDDLLRQLIPSVSTGMKTRAQQPGGLEAILKQVQGTDMEDIFEGREMRPEVTRQRGGGILDQIFGDQAITRDVARRAGERTGLDQSKVEGVLPDLTSIIMGGMQRKTTQDTGMGGALDQLIRGAGQARQQTGGRGGLEDILGQVLGGAAAQPQRQPQQRGGGGLGDVLGSILGGGARQQAQTQRAPQGGGMGGILGAILGGAKRANDGPGAGGGYNPAGGGGGIDDLLGGILGARPSQRSSTGDRSIDNVIGMFDGDGDGEVDLDVLRQMARRR